MLLSTCISVFAKTPPEPCWKVEFNHANYHECKGIMTPSKAFFDNGVVKFFVQPPDYEKFVCINENNKTYLLYDTNKWFAQMCGGPASVYKTFKLLGDDKVNGINCKHYQCFFASGRLGAEAWTTDTVPVSPKLHDALCAICGTPPQLAGLPAKVLISTHNRAHPWYRLVQLMSLERTKAGATPFTIPRGYKKADNDYTFMLSQDGTLKDSDIEDLFEHHFKGK